MTRQEAKDAIALLITDPENEQNTPALVRAALSIILDSDYNSADDGVPAKYGYDNYLEVEFIKPQIEAIGSQLNFLPILSEGYYDAKIIIESNFGTTPYNFGSQEYIVLRLNNSDIYINSDLLTRSNDVIFPVPPFTNPFPDFDIGKNLNVATSYADGFGNGKILTLNGDSPSGGDGTILFKIWYNIRPFGTEL